MEGENFFTNTFGHRLAALSGLASGSLTDTLKATDQRAVALKDGIEKIRVEALSLAKNDNFFWVSGIWKWLEIIFWGEFGVIVSIMVWVSTQFSDGKYTREIFSKEWRWYLTEIVIGPIVVTTAFFLLSIIISGFLEGITEEQIRSSIYLTLGVSFTLGFFIRRTLGILDFIKNKLPLPSSGN
jgi:hypothetical protein